MMGFQKADVKRLVFLNACAFLSGMISPAVWTAPLSAAVCASVGACALHAGNLIFGLLAAALFAPGGLGTLLGGMLSYLISSLLSRLRPENADASCAVGAFLGCLLPAVFSLFRMDAWQATAALLSPIMAMAAAPVVTPAVRRMPNVYERPRTDERLANSLLMAVLLAGACRINEYAGLFLSGLFALALSDGAMNAALGALISASGMILGGIGARHAAVVLLSAGAAGAVYRLGVWVQAFAFLVSVPLGAYLGGSAGEACLAAGALFYPLIPKWAFMRFRNLFIEKKHEEAPPYSIVAFRQHRPPVGVRVCGDYGSIEKIDESRMLIMLADGMGMGKPARALSRRAVTAAGMFIRANVEERYAESAINRLTMNAESGEEYSTLDTCVIDLHSGSAKFMKSGGEAAWVLKKNGIIRIESETLPVGVLFDAPPMKKKVRLKAGDAVFLATDGLINALGGPDSTECALIRYQKLAPSAMVRNLMRDAQKNASASRADDMSAICARIQRREGKDARETAQGVIAIKDHADAAQRAHSG